MSDRSSMFAFAAAVTLAAAARAAAAENEPASLEEIVVTAQKRESSLQETPLSIQALGTDALDNAGVENTLDLRLVAPGVLISTNSASAEIFIRGVGTNFGGDPSAAFHVDGVYYVSTHAALQDFLDVERIEILKGPQGTLYGRNATAGVINVISKRPTMDWEFEGDLQYGNFNKFRQRAMLNAPLLTDRLAARISFVNSDRDGYRRNPFLGTRIDDENSYAVRGQLLFTPHDEVEIAWSGDYSKVDDSRTLGFKVNPNVFAPQVDVPPTLGLPGGTVPDDPDIIFSDKDSVQHNKHYGTSLNVEWDLGPAVLTSLSAYRETSSVEDLDVDGTEVAWLNSSERPQARWISQELRLASDGHGPIEWIAGLYYLDDVRRNGGTFELPLPQALGLVDGPIHRDSDQSSESYAGFLQSSYQLSERFRVTGGARYTHEEKRAMVYVNANKDLGVAGREDASWDAFTPKLGLDYFPIENVMLYVSVTRGFKAGGFSGLDEFAPEYIWSYESGLRSTVLDGRLRFNATAFYYDYNDIQVNQILAEPDPVTGSPTTVGNAASAEVKGLEIEVLTQPIERLQLRVYASFLDARYKNYISPNTEVDGNPPVDLSGNRMPRAPKFAATLTAKYSWPVGNIGTACLQGDLYHQSQIFFTPFNNVNDIYGQQKAHEVVNARLCFDSDDGRWNAAIYAENLGNEVYRQNVLRALGFFGQLDLLASPRTYGIQVGVKF